jgi:ribosome-binding factor A
LASHRIERLEKDIKVHLSREIPTLKDPRIDCMPSVVRVDVTPDSSYATILISSVFGFDRAKECCEALNGAAGILRTSISKTMHIRKAPELNFIPDGSAEYADHINRILEKIKNESEN